VWNRMVVDEKRKLPPKSPVTTTWTVDFFCGQAMGDMVPHGSTPLLRRRLLQVNSQIIYVCFVCRRVVCMWESTGVAFCPSCLVCFLFLLGKYRFVLFVSWDPLLPRYQFYVLLVSVLMFYLS
jgi:hypothetical protein